MCTLAKKLSKIPGRLPKFLTFILRSLKHSEFVFTLHNVVVGMVC